MICARTSNEPIMHEFNRPLSVSTKRCRHRNCHSLLYVLVSVIAILPSAAGCGRNAGPPRYDLSGSVTYDGKPVPCGSIVFAPDISHGNEGPGAIAPITNGVYSTRPGYGTVGGPHVATLSGYETAEVQGGPLDNPIGKTLFTNVSITADLPRRPATHDFAVPTTGK